MSISNRFGIRSLSQVKSDLSEVVRDGLKGTRFQFDLRSAGLLWPALSLPAYLGTRPIDGLAPIFNLFDRVGGGARFTQRVSRKTLRDFRGGRLSYDEHDGTDLVCPIGTPVVAAAPGVVVMVRDRWLRGGLTIAVDHGCGVVTQYTHCSRAMREPGEVVQRGDVVALSGAAGYDMVQFFPWVPPHIHFMVYVDGMPVDPFLSEGEAKRAGIWMHGNEPMTAGVLPEDPRETSASDVDRPALERVAAACTDPKISEEISRVAERPAELAALLEDALVHDAWAFALDTQARPRVRPAASEERDRRARSVALTLPLPASDYRGIRFADSPFTRPH